MPLLILLAAYPERSAMAASLAAIGLIALEGAIFFALHGDVEFKYAALVGIPATFGVLGGDESPAAGGPRAPLARVRGTAGP